jgi:hypothetical protein
MPKDKSVTIPTAASDPAPKPSPHGLTKMFSTVAKGPIVPSNRRQSPRSSVPPVLTLAKGPNKPKGLVPLEVAHQEQVALTELMNTEGDFLVGLDDSQEEREVEGLASPMKPEARYESSENELSNTGFLGRAGQR